MSQLNFFCSFSFSLWNSFIKYNLNSTEIQEANSKAISLCAYVPPYLPLFEIIPLALVFSIHCLGVKIKLLEPDLYLNLSNSMGLNNGLFRSSHNPNSSIVLLFLSQFCIT
jgi:hypothetical protein